MAYKTTNPATGLVTESFDNISALVSSQEPHRLSEMTCKGWPRSFPETWESLFRTR
jgi:hypothetical protein